MADGFTLEITGIDELITKYSQADPMAEQILTGAMGLAVDLVQTDAEIYAPESEANQPPPPFYQRGTGTIYADGSTRGESQQMGSHWEKLITLEDNGVIGTVSNPVTYSPWLHSIIRQTPVHAARGWRKVDKIAQDTEERVVQIFNNAAATLAAFLRR
jgi:hypothetical protein